MFHPKEFFQNMPTEGGYLGPLKFALICNVPYILSSCVLALSAGLTGLKEIQITAVAVQYSFLGTVISAGSAIAMVLVSLFVGAALSQLGVSIFAPKEKKDYLATFRVFCYASAIQVFKVTPVVFVSLIELYLLIIGIRIVHRTTWKRAGLALAWKLIIIGSLVGRFITEVLI
jgi:hypothetical protein